MGKNISDFESRISKCEIFASRPLSSDFCRLTSDLLLPRLNARLAVPLCLAPLAFCHIRYARRKAPGGKRIAVHNHLIIPLALCTLRFKQLTLENNALTSWSVPAKLDLTLYNR